MEIRFPDGEPSECVMHVRKASQGSYVAAGVLILEYTRPDKTIGKIYQPIDGVVMYAKVCNKGFLPESGSLLAKVEQCDHSIVIKDLCGSCGKELRTKDGMVGQRSENASASVSMIHNVPELHVSNELAKEIGTQDKEHILAARKLVLMVDLDQTIIHTTNKPHGSDLEGKSDITSYKLYGGTHYTKLRPYTKEFLENMAKLFEMHIITYGQRQYAHKIADIIDPERKLFGHRVLSRDECFSQQHKSLNLKALFPTGDQLVAIIDDRADVWKYSEALIQVKPYRYFKEVGDINAPAGHQNEPVAELSNNDHDRVLEDIERILTDVHKAFYQQYDATGEVKDLKVVISWLKSQVFRDLKFVISGVKPMDEKPEKCELYRKCKQFGATLSENVTEETTHVIAARWGTKKVHQALNSQIPIVTPGWLHTSMERWLRADEKEFELTEDTVVPSGSGDAPKLSELSQMPTMGRNDMKNMCDEVDAALGDEDDDDVDEETGGDEEQTEDDDVEGIEEDDEEQTPRGIKRPREASVEEYVPSDEDDVDNEMKKARILAKEEDSDAEDNKSDQDYGEDSSDEEKKVENGGEEEEAADDEEGNDEADSDDDMAAELEHMME